MILQKVSPSASLTIDEPKFGGPLPSAPIGSPSLPMTLANPSTLGTAVLTPGTSATIGGQRIRNSLALLRAEVAFDDDRRAHVRVGVFEHVGEQIVERLRQRVGEDVGTGQERGTEDDREGGEQQPALASQDALQGEFEHRSLTKALHAVEYEVSRRREHLVDDLAVGQEDHPVGVAGGIRDRG